MSSDPSKDEDIPPEVLGDVADAVEQVEEAVADAVESVLSASSTETPEERRRHVEDLIQMIKDSADKLASDNSSRGDLKILSRTMRELRYAFKVFSPYRSRRKVTVFGSARTRPEEETYIQAVECGKAFAEKDWLVITGAASGIMEAGHRGAGRSHSMGLNIMLPFEQSSNPIIAGDSKLVHMKYFFTRKLMFVKECDAVVCLPGGYGTLDEFLEVITLLQTGKRDIIPVVLLDAKGGNYWQAMQEFVDAHLLKGRMISPEDYSLYKITDNVQEAVDEVMNFFRNYHSMRYVRNQLVLRMNEPLHPMLLDDIRFEFKDLISGDGTFEQLSALAAEKDEPELADKPRLAFTFNRRNLGRLRQLIDVINRGSIGK